MRDLYDTSYHSAKVLVVLTDGDSDDSISSISSDMRNDGFVILAVGINNVKYAHLLVLTGDADRILQVEDYTQLADHLDFLRNALCQNYGY